MSSERKTIRDRDPSCEQAEVSFLLDFYLILLITVVVKMVSTLAEKKSASATNTLREHR